MVAAQRAVALEVGADPRDLVLLPNATTAVNTVLRSLGLRRGQYLLVTDLTYPAVSTDACRKSGTTMLVQQNVGLCLAVCARENSVCGV